MQFELFETRFRNAAELAAFLSAGTGVTVDLKLTQNRTSMLSVRFPEPGRVAIRMHAHYLNAPEKTLAALRDFLKNRRRSDWRAAASFVRQIPASAIARVESAGLNVRGAVYDLAEIFRGVNEEFFSGRVACRIGWSRAAVARKRSLWRRFTRKSRSVRFGSWHAGGRLIRINPVLDSHDVPLEFVRYIVYHEMLHAVVPPELTASGRRDHTKQFRALERNFPGFDRMSSIADDILRRLP